jgi:hypothetical protein
MVLFALLLLPLFLIEQETGAAGRLNRWVYWLLQYIVSHIPGPACQGQLTQNRVPGS